VNAEATETEAQNEQAIVSGGAVNNGNNTNNNSNGSTIVTSGNRNTNTGSNNNTTTNSPVNNNNNTENGNTQKPTTPTTPTTPQPQVHAPIYEKRWVVDQAAWSEEVPVWGNKYIERCSACGADITGPQSEISAHIKEHAIKGENAGYRTEVVKVQVGTQIIYHDEVGHWEDVLLCAGCTSTH